MPNTLSSTLLQLDQRISRLIDFNRLADFLRQNRNLLVYLFISGVIAYGYDLFAFSMRIDSEHHAYTFGPQGAWIAQGRWGMYLLSYLLIPDVVMPFIPTLIAVSGCAIGALFLVHTLSPRRSIADYAAAPIAIACPVIYFALYFTTLGYGVGVAFATTSIGVYLLSRNNWRTALMAIPCFTLGIGIYQAVLPLIACLFCLALISCIIENRQASIGNLSKQVAIFALVLALSVGLNQLITLLTLKVMHVHFDSAYISSFIQIQFTREYFTSTLDKTLLTAWNYYTGGKDYYLFDMTLLKVMFIFTLAITVWRITTAENSITVRIAGLLLLLAALIAPVIMLMMNAGYMPPRTMLGVAYVLAGLVFFTASIGSQVLRFVTIVMAAYCFYNFSMINNRYAFSNQMSWYADRELVLQMLERIHTVMNKLPPQTDPYATTPLEIVGWHEYFETPVFIHREVIGSSFFTWGAGDAERIIRLMKTMGIAEFRPATNNEKVSVIETAQHMPSWPYEGSVDLVNGVIVVKFREYNPNQLMWMCEPPNESHPSCLKYLSK